jgi:uncharacterized membrane protein
MKRRRESYFALMVPELRPDNRRIEAFSDAVFAIVVTLMMLEVRVPDGLAFGRDPAALQAFATLLATYALSFVITMILWASHHYLVFTIPKPDRTTIWLNTLILFCVTLIPISAQFFGFHPTSPRAAAAYGLVLMACTASFSLLRAHAVRICPNQLHRAIHLRVLHKAWIAIAIYAASMILAFVDIRFAWACFLITPVMFFLPVVRPPTLPPTADEGDHESTTASRA